MIDWKKKLTSRKFWVSFIAMISGIMLAFKADGDTVKTVSGVLMCMANAIAYVIGEGLVDSAHAGEIEIPIEVVQEENNNVDKV